jgi:hypothetical protein
VDLVYAVRSPKIRWSRNSGGSQPTWTNFDIALVDCFALHARDVDGDTRVDVVGVVASSTLSWFKNGGGATPTWTTYSITTGLNTIRSVYVEDMDGDGARDVVALSRLDSKVTVCKSSGGSVPTWTCVVIGTLNYPQAVIAIDVDRWVGGWQFWYRVW